MEVLPQESLTVDTQGGGGGGYLQVRTQNPFLFCRSKHRLTYDICFSEQTIKFSSLIYLPPSLSNDDKARVPPGLAAASLQAPILMHLEYKVRLPDHTFVVASRHTLIPSVYGLCEVRQNGDLSVSGDTFNRVRSATHDYSKKY